VELNELRVHAFCGQRHASVACPDGLVVCCICFDRFPIERLNTVGLDGQQMDCPEDVCVPCAEADRTAVVVRWMASAT
jgi:hypothetical protein